MGRYNAIILSHNGKNYGKKLFLFEHFIPSNGHQR
jgi:hypothetical protein